MAKKKRAEQPKHEPTKYQVSKWQSQEKRQRRFLFIGIAILAAVGGILGGGWYSKEYLPFHETVIRVNQTEFNMQYYADMLELRYRFGLSGDAVEFIQQNELIKQGAAEMGVTVDEDELAAAIREYDAPSTVVGSDIMEAELLNQQLLSGRFNDEVPETMEQRHVAAMFLESESQAEGVRARLMGGEDFSALSGALSLEPFTKSGGGDLGWHPYGLSQYFIGSSIPQDYAFSSAAGALSAPLYDETLSKQLGYWLVEIMDVIDAEEEAEVKVQARVMLLGSWEEAVDIRAQIENGGDFAELAQAHSQDLVTRDRGGDMGEVSRIDVADFLEEFIFDSKAGTLSQPLRDDRMSTLGGYWLVKVLDVEEDRPLADEDREILKQEAFDEWVISLWADPDNVIEDYLDAEKVSWAATRAFKAGME